MIDDKFYEIESLKAVVGGVKVFLSNDNGKLMEIGNGYGSKIIDVGKCREWFDLTRPQTAFGDAYESNNYKKQLIQNKL